MSPPFRNDHNEWTEIRYGRRGRTPRIRIHLPDFDKRNQRIPSQNGRGSAKLDHRSSYAEVATQPRRTQIKNKYNYIPTSPQFRTMIKYMSTLIRTVHHLQNVTTTKEENQPVTFQRLEKYLSNIIKPAFPDDQVGLLLMGNAKNWAYTTQLILEDHYELTIKQTLEDLIPVIQDNWHEAFDVAKKWATRNLGHRLTQDTTIHAEALIIAALPSAPQTVTKTQTRTTNKDRKSVV